jgi:hypothetical protein
MLFTLHSLIKVGMARAIQIGSSAVYYSSETTPVVVRSSVPGPTYSTSLAIILFVDSTLSLALH